MRASVAKRAAIRSSQSACGSQSSSVKAISVPRAAARPAFSAATMPGTSTDTTRGSPGAACTTAWLAASSGRSTTSVSSGFSRCLASAARQRSSASGRR
jgi:hypothetical protein